MAKVFGGVEVVDNVHRLGILETFLLNLKQPKVKWLTGLCKKACSRR
jgi:hypothetical protein